MSLETKEEGSMSERDEAFNRLVDGVGSDASECPFGYYLCSMDPGGAGAFHWHETEDSLFNEIKHDLFAWFPDDGEQRDDEIRAGLTAIIDGVLSNPKLGDKLRAELDHYLIGGGMRMEWLGTFEQLCESYDGWAENVREQYRECAIYDTEDLSCEELKTPIKIDDIAGFADYVRVYGQN